MRYIKSFSIFERKSDLDRISNVEKLYIDIFEKIKLKTNDYIIDNDIYYYLLLDFYIPMAVSFDRQRTHESFGKIQLSTGQLLPCLFLMSKDYCCNFY